VILRARARQLCANSEYAKRFLGLVARNVVGPCGPMLQVRAMLSGWPRARQGGQ
jgi:capsid protein